MVWIAATGIEDHPLVRDGTGFGFVDSFLYLFKSSAEGTPQIVSSLNLSSRKCPSPRGLKLAVDPVPTIVVACFGGSGLWKFEWKSGALTGHLELPLAPGTEVIAWGAEQNLLAVNPLLDRLELWGCPTRRAFLQLSSGPRSPTGRIGELLFFTDLLAPSNLSRGPLSSATCEACHPQGGFDGRTHYTGRSNVFVTTRPLFGLPENLPLFSRAGTADIPAMVVAEFDVANQGSSHFEIEKLGAGWLDTIEALPSVMGPLELRRAFVDFFYDFKSPINPWRLRKRKLSAKAMQGLEIFRDNCQDCHQPRTSTQTKLTVPFQDWPRFLLDSELDLVWGASFSTKTGILPYVSKAGTRVPSLRRIWTKYPYFTNGSSRNLTEVLQRFRFSGIERWHEPPPDRPETRSLSEIEIKSLLAVLRFF